MLGRDGARQQELCARVDEAADARAIHCPEDIPGDRQLRRAELTEHLVPAQDGGATHPEPLRRTFQSGTWQGEGLAGGLGGAVHRGVEIELLEPSHLRERDDDMVGAWPLRGELDDREGVRCSEINLARERLTSWALDLDRGGSGPGGGGCVAINGD